DVSRHLYALPDLAVLGKHFAAAQGLDRRWSAEAACRSLVRSSSEMSQAWLLGENDRTVVDGVAYHGGQTYRLALAYCETCPVQWDCAAFGLATGDAFHSLFSMPTDDARWLA